MTSMPAPQPRRLEELQAEAAHRRRRVDIYRAKTYGPRMTSPARMRELEREADAADARLAAAVGRGGSAGGAGGRSPGPGPGRG